MHGLPALRLAPGNKWLDVAMIRMNHKGRHGLGDCGRARPGNVNEL